MQDQKFDERFLWQRNVQDRYKSWETDAIKADLKAKALPCAVLMAQIEHDFNFGCLVRNANAFGAEAVYYYGRRHWDRRAAEGVYKYTDVIHLPNIEAVAALKDRYTFVGLENNIEGTTPLQDFQWPAKPLLCFGEEKDGLQSELLALLDHLVEIPLRGSVRSINVGAASAASLYAYSLTQGRQ
jgi:tRNA G18 (ribose-2'-O)-methylase SpoU